MEQSTITCPKCGHATTETILQKHRTGKDGAEHEADDKRGGECQDVDGHDYSLTFCNMAKTIMAIASRTVQVITSST